MRCLKRNRQPFWYSLYLGERVPGDTAEAGTAIASVSVVGDEDEDIDYIIDEYGNKTGEVRLHYSDPVRTEANISPATGQSNIEQFGNLDSYDKVIVTDDVNCPIDEHSILFIETEPEKNAEGDYVYDYIVKRVAKSINSVSIAVRKVKIG